MLQKADEWVSAFEKLVQAKPAPKQNILMNQESLSKEESPGGTSELRFLVIELSEV